MTMPLFPALQTEVTTDDRYTPKWIFDAMGLQFDLDVAAPPGGIPWIPAQRFYTKAEDGLAQPWEGLIFCNPPFSKLTPWADKWCEHPDGVFLSCVSKARWVARLMAAAELIWIPPVEVDFIFPDGAPGQIGFLIFLAARGRGVPGLVRLRDIQGGVLLADWTKCA